MDNHIFVDSWEHRIDGIVIESGFGLMMPDRTCQFKTVYKFDPDKELEKWLALLNLGWKYQDGNMVNYSNRSHE